MKPSFAQQLANAIRAHEPLPAFESKMDLDEAYQLQHEVTQARTQGDIGGIKAGVTNRQIQEFFQLEGALIGSLYADAALPVGATLVLIPGRMIECEVAIQLDRDGKPLAIAPAIEIVRVDFSEPTDLSAANLVACNLGADAYLIGPSQPWRPPYDALSVTLRRGEAVLNQASMNDALGGPENAAKWMWQEALKRGFTINDDTWFLAGACGTVMPCETGHYCVDFGPLGEIEFSIA